MTGETAGRAALLRSVLRDPWTLAMLALMAASAIVRLAAGDLPQALRLHDAPLVALAAAALLVRATRATGRLERRFWGLWATAYVVWLLIRLWELGPGQPDSWEPGRAIFRDLAYVVFYFCIVASLEVRPDQPRERGATLRLQAIRTTAATTMVIALLLYFAILPSTLLPNEYVRRTPSFLFYSTLDLSLVGLLVVRFRQARGRTWHEVYRWLLFTVALWLLSDASSALAYLGLAPVNVIGVHGLRAIQFDFLTLMVAVRLANRARGAERLPGRPWLVEPGAPRGLWGTPMTLYIIILPLVHLTLSVAGTLDPALHVARETLVIVFLVILSILAYLYERTAEAERERLSAETMERARDSQRFEALGQLATGISHDFNNLMTISGLSAGMVRERLPPDSPLRSDLETIENTVDRASELVGRLLAFGRGSESQRVCDLSELVHGLSKPLRRLLPATIRLEIDAPPIPRPAAITPAAAEQILMNLATNARDAMPQGGCMRIALSLARRAVAPGDVAPGEFALLSIADDGTGIPDEVRPHLFRPYFTTKAPGHGTGLGLAMVAELVRIHHGDLDLESQAGRGTTVRIYLPLAADAPPAEPAGAPATPPSPGSAMILVVEDEPQLRDLAARVLEQEGFRVLLAGDGEEGLDLFLRHRDEVSLVITDVVMPRKSGLELSAAILALGSTPILLTSGYSEIEAGSVLGERLPRLLKPWSARQLDAKVRELLAASSP